MELAVKKLLRPLTLRPISTKARSLNYTIELEIEKPLSEVGALFGDEQNLAKWQPGYLGREEVEGKTVLKYEKGKKTIDMIEEIHLNELPGEFTATFRFQGMEMTVQNLFTEAGDNRTRWITHNTCKTSGIFKILVWMMKGCAKRESLTFMENFKAFAETGKGLND